MAKKHYIAETLNGGTVTGTHQIDEAGKHFIIVKHEGVTTTATWQVKPGTVKEVR